MLKSASSVFVFCLLGRLACTDNQPLTVKSGENATLQCYGSRGAAVVILRWRSRDLQSQQINTDKQLYVLYIRENHNYDKFQLPSFKGRVQLRDPEMKDGDLSVIIKNVSMNDAGIYECYAGYDTQNASLINSTNLKVEEPGSSGGQSGDGENKDNVKEDCCFGMKIGLSVLGVLLIVVVGVVGFLIYKICKIQSNYQPPPGQDIEMLPAAS